MGRLPAACITVCISLGCNKGHRTPLYWLLHHACQLACFFDLYVTLLIFLVCISLSWLLCFTSHLPLSKCHCLTNISPLLASVLCRLTGFLGLSVTFQASLVCDLSCFFLFCFLEGGGLCATLLAFSIYVRRFWFQFFTFQLSWLMFWFTVFTLFGTLVTLLVCQHYF